ncbi:MAG: chemotaxis protein CheW [Proteobacteria bacterium]|nr:chemotaxis protein CheW [Pseudomonadota bacterium]
MQRDILTPFAVLAALEQTVLRCAKDLPYHETNVENWVGVSFLSGQHVLLTPLEEVVEIMRVPLLAEVPGVKPWLRGMVTSHGELFPVTDLNGFLCGKISLISHLSRILVIQTEKDTSGILVDRVLGLQRIQDKEKFKKTSHPIPELAPFMMGAFRNAYMELPVISCKAIMQNPKFRDVALRGNEIIEDK